MFESNSSKLTWAGRVLSALPVLALSISAAMKLSRSPEVLGAFTEKFGYPASTLSAIAALELLVALLYAVPRTAVLGAILMTAYLGGGVATHVRVSDPFFAPVVLSVLSWLGLYLRDARLRALVPLRKAAEIRERV
ncbi:MAG TPA: DoxX family protein [Myxococcaceae bacterium]|nr:DoxX family protein [Myxococcaceae bacterium]